MAESLRAKRRGQVSGRCEGGSACGVGRAGGAGGGLCVSAGGTRGSARLDACTGSVSPARLLAHPPGECSVPRCKELEGQTGWRVAGLWGIQLRDWVGWGRRAGARETSGPEANGLRAVSIQMVTQSAARMSSPEKADARELLLEDRAHRDGPLPPRWHSGPLTGRCLSASSLTCLVPGHPVQ